MTDVHIRMKWDMDLSPPAYLPTKGKYLSEELITIRYPATVGLTVV